MGKQQTAKVRRSEVPNCHILRKHRANTKHIGILCIHITSQACDLVKLQTKCGPHSQEFRPPTFFLFLSLGEEALLAGDLHGFLSISLSGVSVPLPRFGRLRAFCNMSCTGCRTCNKCICIVPFCNFKAVFHMCAQTCVKIKLGNTVCNVSADM